MCRLRAQGMTGGIPCAPPVTCRRRVQQHNSTKRLRQAHFQVEGESVDDSTLTADDIAFKNRWILHMSLKEDGFSDPDCARRTLPPFCASLLMQVKQTSGCVPSRARLPSRTSIPGHSPPLSPTYDDRLVGK